MKRLILLSTLLLFVLASCDAPFNNVAQQPQQPAQPKAVAPTTPYSLEQMQPDTIRKAMWEQFKAQHGEEWRVRWNKHTGLPASIFSGLTKVYPGSAEQAARAFMTEHVSLFGFSDLNRLKHVNTRTHRGMRHVSFKQMVDDVPVYEAEYKVHLRPGGQVDMANGTYYPNIEVSTTSSVSKAGAASTAKSDLNIQADQDLNVHSELMIYRLEEQFHLAWKLILSSKQPVQNWLYFIDASSGEILHKANRLSNITGDGDIYPTHPDLSSVTNADLYRLDNNGRLQGTYAYVVNDNGSEAYSSTHSFIYNPNNTHFDEVNLYHHVDEFRQNYINNISNSSLGFTQITAHAHAEHPDDGDLNAFYNPSSKDIYFGDAESSSNFNDFAKEDKVIYHEYGHAVIDDVNSGIDFGNNEEGAISEGTPDYWAGSFTGRTLYGEYSAPFFDRDMGDPDITNYSQYESEEPVGGHAGGEFFSAIL